MSIFGRCGHCKKLAPEYERLGASFKRAKSVLIGKVIFFSFVHPSAKDDVYLYRANIISLRDYTVRKKGQTCT